MRAPALALFAWGQPASLEVLTRAATEVTHGHTLAIQGAQAVARATLGALGAEPPRSIVEAAQSVVEDAALRGRLGTAGAWLEREPPPAPREIRETLGAGMTAVESAATAIYLGARTMTAPLQDLLDLARAVGGDVDTIGAMAGALWGACNGFEAIPRGLTDQLEDLQRLVDVADALWRRAAP